MLATYDIDIDRVGLPGVQDKVSMARLSVPVRGQANSYILKLDPPEYRHLVANEAFFLARAARSRVRAAKAEIVHDRDGLEGLVVTRFDRVRAAGRMQTRAVEDGCQMLGVHPADTYRVTTERVLGALAAVCAAPRPAALEFLRQATFAYVTRDGDAHAKNFSVVADSAGRYGPAPAYDVPSSLPYGDSTLALSVQGRRDGNITGRRFVALGEALGLTARAARRAVDETAAAVDGWIDELGDLPFDPGRIKKLRRIITRRRTRLRER